MSFEFHLRVKKKVSKHHQELYFTVVFRLINKKKYMPLFCGFQEKKTNKLSLGILFTERLLYLKLNP